MSIHALNHRDLPPVPRHVWASFSCVRGPHAALLCAPMLPHCLPPSWTVWGPQAASVPPPPRLPQCLTGRLGVTMTAWISPGLSQCHHMLLSCPHSCQCVAITTSVCPWLPWCVFLSFTATTEHPPSCLGVPLCSVLRELDEEKRSLRNEIFQLVALVAANVQPLID